MQSNYEDEDYSSSSSSQEDIHVMRLRPRHKIREPNRYGYENELSSHDLDLSEEAEEAISEDIVNFLEATITRAINSDHLKEVVDDLVSDFISQAAVEYEMENKVYEKRWKVGLNRKTIRKYQERVNQIRDTNKKKIPTMLRIMEAPMPFEEQCQAVEKLEVYEHLPPHSVTKLAWRRELNKLIGRYSQMGIDQYQIDRLLEQDKKIKKAFRSQIPLRIQILEKRTSDENKALILEKYYRLQEISAESSEHGKLREWMDWALSVPSESKTCLPTVLDGPTVIESFLFKVRRKLDSQVFGLENVKEQILCIVTKKITNPNATDLSLGLVGSMGTGKTTIVRALGKALGLPFEQISLGGCRDSSYLDGHSYTYEGAQPGAIVQCLKKMKYNNGILFFDEFDKLGNTERGKEVSWGLLHVTDSTQNHEFKDKYLGEIKIDLSKMWFMYSLNCLKNVDRILLDRLHVIRIPDYGLDDKVRIGLEYMLPLALQGVGMRTGDVIMNQEQMRYLISKSKTKEKGVRQLKRNIESIVYRLNILRLKHEGSARPKKRQRTQIDLSFDTIPDFTIPIEITSSVIDSLFYEYHDNENLAMTMYL